MQPMFGSGRRLLVLSASALVLLACGSTAQATIISYADQASWNAAVTNVTTVTVPDPAPDAFTFLGSGSASVAYGPFTFAQQGAFSDGFFYNVGSLFSGSPAVLSSQQQSTGVANILVTFPGPVTAAAINFGTFGGSPVTFTLSNGDSIVLNSTGSGYSVPDFFGITDNVPFTSVLITSADGVLNIGGASSATAIVPEPATLAAFGLMAVVGGGYVRRRKLTATA